VSELRWVDPFRCKMWVMHDRLSGGDVCDELIESIRAHGQKQPVLGRQLAGDVGYDIELIYGARRLHAARELRVNLIVKVCEIDDRAALIEMDIENRVREDISPYERGINYKAWLRSGLFTTQAEMAKALCVSQARICRMLKYAELPTVVVEAFCSPTEIREEWAGALAKLCKDHRSKSELMQRARKVALRRQRLSPPQVYNALVNDYATRSVRNRSRDEVVKDAEGKPLFRIGYRSRWVQLMLPRDGLTDDVLRPIVTQIKTRLEPHALRVDLAQRVGTRRS
jgi:ParB family transcriptional regulator, chromosome partitioning protein